MKICNSFSFFPFSLSLSGFSDHFFFCWLLAPLCNVFYDEQFPGTTPGGLRVVRNSDRWEYGMGLAHSLPLWLSATLQGAGRRADNRKKKVVGSGVLKLMVLTRNTMLLCAFLEVSRGSSKLCLGGNRHRVIVKQHQPGSGHRALLNSRNIRIPPKRTAICGLVPLPFSRAPSSK